MKCLYRPTDMESLLLYGYIEKGTELSSGKTTKFELSEEYFRRKHYLGMSQIANCGRKLWYEFHTPEAVQAPKFDNAMLRRFQLGHIVEALTFHYIKTGGGKVTHQQTTLSLVGDKFVGHPDGVLNDKYLIEVKGLNDSSSKKLLPRSAQIVKDQFPAYYAQVQLYMHCLGLIKAFLLVYSKNNSEYVIVKIGFDPQYAFKIIGKAHCIINSKSADEVLEEYCSLEEETCKWCPLQKMCWRI